MKIIIIIMSGIQLSLSTPPLSPPSPLPVTSTTNTPTTTVIQSYYNADDDFYAHESGIGEHELTMEQQQQHQPFEIPDSVSIQAQLPHGHQRLQPGEMRAPLPLLPPLFIPLQQVNVPVLGSLPPLPQLLAFAHPSGARNNNLVKPKRMNFEEFCTFCGVDGATNDDYLKCRFHLYLAKSDCDELRAENEKLKKCVLLMDEKLCATWNQRGTDKKNTKHYVVVLFQHNTLKKFYISCRESHCKSTVFLQMTKRFSYDYIHKCTWEGLNSNVKEKLFPTLKEYLQNYRKYPVSFTDAGRQIEFSELLNIDCAGFIQDVNQLIHMLNNNITF